MFAEQMARGREFVQGFQKSRRGNLWRRWNGVTLTVYQQGSGYYGFCIASEEGPQFSARSYETEAECLDALWVALG
jgi:hypothetical protein